jgi:hypothetical protein
MCVLRRSRIIGTRNEAGRIILDCYIIYLKCHAEEFMFGHVYKNQDYILRRFGNNMEMIGEGRNQS